MAGVHGTVKPFVCTFRGCDFATSTNCNLASHMKKAKMHEEDRKRAKIIDEACDKILHPFLCKVRTSNFDVLMQCCFKLLVFDLSFLLQVARCIKRFPSDLERERHMERLH